MKYKAAILIGLWSAQLSLATSLLARDECTVLEGVRDSVRLGSRTKEAALDILKVVAEGGVDSSGPGSESMLALTGEELRKQERRAAVARELEAAMTLMGFQMRTGRFASSKARACALTTIGDLDTTEALEHLESLRKEDLGPGWTEGIWEGARIGLFKARLRRIAGKADRIAFLERTITEKDPADWYAEEELCNAGNYPSLPLIRESIRLRSPDRAAKDIGNCEARMEIVSRNPDRVAAIASFLKADGKPMDEALIGWSIRQLCMMESPRVDAELRRYANELERLRDPSGRGLALLPIQSQLAECAARGNRH